MIRPLVVFAITMAYASIVRAGDTQPPCLSYEPTQVTIEGSIERKTFPGRPNYESVASGDEPETYWLLNLTAPICVAGPPDELNSPEEDVSQVQLILNGEQYAQYKHLVGHRVRATGTLMHSITAHHKTPVLLSVQGLFPSS